MAYFVWADDMVIDNGPIDSDHQMLIEQVNQLHTATQAGRGQEIVGQLLDTLIRSTIDHIQREEQFMARINYPRLTEHQAGHENFVSKLRELQGKFTSGSITVAAQLSTLLRDWLSLHIRRYDKDIFHFMQQKKRPQRSR